MNINYDVILCSIGAFVLGSWLGMFIVAACVLAKREDKRTGKE